jgi:serine/threonine-protein kinase
VDEESIFAAALEKARPEERGAFLAQACAGDAALRGRVEALLQAHDNPDSFLEAPPVRPEPTVDDPGGSECLGAIIGPYKLLEQIGEGGFGVVFMAEQAAPVRRKVALKVLKPGMDSRQVSARFEAERQALALMDHPNIARVLDGGQTSSGRPYFVMDLVKGLPITEYCDQARLALRERLELFVHLCQAVQHAHQKGIIHRDLKPSNVLVTVHDTRPVVKVIDFGIAKALGQELTDKTLFTGFAQMIGTPLYMSPEQAGQSGLDVDTRSDIYSLGVLLYELLTGTTPFDKERLRTVGYDELRRIIREEEPPRPSTRISTLGQAATTASANRKSDPKQLSRLFRGELDWIVMKALEKDRNRRYDSANGFAADVGRYLADEPVQACPPSAWYRSRKFARRNKRRLAVAALALLLLATLGGVAGWAAWDRVARRAALEADVGRDLDAAQAFCRADRLREASAVLDHAQALVARGGAGEGLARRVARVRTDVDMAVRLDAIRLERASVKDGAFDFAGADAHYRDAFRDYGLDVTSLDPGVAAARVEESAIKDQLLAALHDWLVVRSVVGPSPDGRLLAVLGRADADPWRGRLRDAFGRRDKKTLQELARGPEGAAQPPATVVLLGAVLEGLGERRLAAEMLRSAQQRHPDDFWVNHQLGWCLVALKPAGAAVRYYQAAVALRPDNPAAHLNLGVALFQQGDPAGAAAEFRTALELQPDNAKAHNGLGAALYDLGNLPGAVAEHRKALALQPEYAQAHTNLGNALCAQGDPAGAIAEHRKALDLQPNLAEVHVNLGNALRAQGDPAGAGAECRKAIGLKPDLAEAHAILGAALAELGDRAGAAAEHRKAFDLRPGDAKACYDLGVALRELDDLPGAAAEFRMALALKPEYADAHNSLGVTLMELGDPVGAEAECRKAIALRPTNALAHSNLGNALRDQGEAAGAAAEYLKALDLQPGNAITRYNLGLALDDQGDLAGAVAEYRKALTVRPDYAEAYCNLGNALLRLGEFQAALAELRRGDELGSRNSRWKYPSAAWVRRCQRMVELDGRLPDILAGKANPTDTEERIRLALFFSYKRLHRAANRFFEDGFRQPDAAPYVAALRYDAARGAARAAAGQGKDADRLDDKERTRLRRQALDWLRADLGAWGSRLDREPEKSRLVVVQALRHWQVNPDLAGARGAEALARLPEAERQAWEKLWGNVADTLARAQGRAAPQKKSDAK